MQFDRLSHQVIGCAIEVHRVLGPGLLESAYERCLVRELGLAGLAYEVQKALPLAYKGMLLDVGYRLDVLVEDTLIIELKAVTTLEPIHEAQLLTYMRLSGKRRGLLLNFHVALLRDGIRRFVL